MRRENGLLIRPCEAGEGDRAFARWRGPLSQSFVVGADKSLTREIQILCTHTGSPLMSNGKKQKSSGWQPHEKRYNHEKWKTRHIATTEAQACARNDGIGRWRRCPVLRCRRAQCCAGDPFRCEHPARPKAAAKPNANRHLRSSARRGRRSRPRASSPVSPSRQKTLPPRSRPRSPTTSQPEMLLDDELEAMLRGASVMKRGGDRGVGLSAGSRHPEVAA